MTDNNETVILAYSAAAPTAPKGSEMATNDAERLLDAIYRSGDADSIHHLHRALEGILDYARLLDRRVVRGCSGPDPTSEQLREIIAEKLKWDLDPNVIKGTK